MAEDTGVPRRAGSELLLGVGAILLLVLGAGPWFSRRAQLVGPGIAELLTYVCDNPAFVEGGASRDG